MERKIQKTFVDEGFGFKITLLNVPIVKVRGVWTPDVNYNELSKVVLLALCEKPARLTGNEVKFIRQHFEMTLQDFAKRFCVTHPGVLKWEKNKNRPTGMNWATEKDIRLFVLAKLRPLGLAELYSGLEKEAPSKSEPLKVDASDMAA